MIKLIKTLIDYGYLLREITELVFIVFYPETKTPKFSNQELSIIAKKIKEMNDKIKELENGNRKI